VSADHHSLSVYEWYNADRPAAEHHVAEAVAVLDGRVDQQPEPGPARTNLGHAIAMQGYLAVQATELEQAATFLVRAREVSSEAADPALSVRVGLIDGIRGLLAGDTAQRSTVLDILATAPEHIDEIYSSGFSMLAYVDIEQRRLRQAGELLDVSLPLMAEHDLPICRVWQLGCRGRLSLLEGDWGRAVAEADAVIASRGAPLARTWPLLVRALVALRGEGDPGPYLDDAWRLAVRYGEALRLLPAASAVAERVWLTGVDDPRLAECRRLLGAEPVPGLEWARGELAAWLHRLDPAVWADGIAAPYCSLLAGDLVAAADEFDRLRIPYEAALARAATGDADLARAALDELDRLGARAVADKVRRDMRTAGVAGVPARRRPTTLANPAGLTARQVEVLRLLDGGATNAELAEQLYLSPKTVDHHVSAILGKLQVANRRDAVRRARELRILD
jgi:DNA-binding CsgD family transcriptional regulator